jgi:phosphoglycerate-specific signal transduction histidine kinase
MPQPLTSTKRRTDHVPQELTEIHAHVAKLPLPAREKLQALCDRLAQYTRLQQRLVQIAQDAVDQLQLDVKYLTFDLEVTRRERDELLRELGFGDETS